MRTLYALIGWPCLTYWPMVESVLFVTKLVMLYIYALRDEMWTGSKLLTCLYLFVQFLFIVVYCCLLSARFYGL